MDKNHQQIYKQDYSAQQSNEKLGENNEFSFPKDQLTYDDDQVWWSYTDKEFDIIQKYQPRQGNFSNQPEKKGQYSSFKSKRAFRNRSLRVHNRKRRLKDHQKRDRQASQSPEKQDSYAGPFSNAPNPRPSIQQSQIKIQLPEDFDEEQLPNFLPQQSLNKKYKKQPVNRQDGGSGKYSISTAQTQTNKFSQNNISGEQKKKKNNIEPQNDIPEQIEENSEHPQEETSKKEKENNEKCSNKTTEKKDVEEIFSKEGQEPSKIEHAKEQHETSKNYLNGQIIKSSIKKESIEGNQLWNVNKDIAGPSPVNTNRNIIQHNEEEASPNKIEKKQIKVASNEELLILTILSTTFLFLAKLIFSGGIVIFCLALCPMKGFYRTCLELCNSLRNYIQLNKKLLIILNLLLTPVWIGWWIAVEFKETLLPNLKNQWMNWTWPETLQLVDSQS